MTVTFFPKSPKPRTGHGELLYQTIARADRGECWHGALDQGVAYIVREDLGVVECAKCKERLNPIWVLKQLSFLSDEAKRRHEKNRAVRKKKGTVF